jgi:hypothetical protein
MFNNEGQAVMFDNEDDEDYYDEDEEQGDADAGILSDRVDA